MFRLMYAPTIHQWDTDRAVAPETWYYRWHRQLWEWFAANDHRVKVLWKAGRGNHCEDPVRHWKSRNIRYSTMPMGVALRRVDGVFVDTVSNSVIWDASRVGVPVLCCYLLDNRRVVMPVEGRLHLYHCKDAAEVFGWLDRFISGGLDMRLLEPNGIDWLGRLEEAAGL